MSPCGKEILDSDKTVVYEGYIVHHECNERELALEIMICKCGFKAYHGEWDSEKGKCFNCTNTNRRK